VAFGGVLSRAIVAEVIEVDAVDDMANGALAAELFEAGEKLVFAVEAAVGAVADVVRVVELVGLDELVSDAELSRKGLGVALVRPGERRRIGGDGKGPAAEGLMGGPREISGIGAARKGDDHSAERAQGVEKLRFLGCDVWHTSPV
jgi:hypothetical protein